MQLSRAFDVDLLHIAEHFSIPVSEVAVNWHEIPGMCILQIASFLTYDVVLCAIK